jgi:uncharacterized protein YbaP (TraB family)
MKKINLLILLSLSFSLAVFAQQKKTEQKKPASQQSFDKFPDKKYPSLLWEITGNGLQKPSYLFGTMHVSDKLAFHLGDSFYHAIKNVQMVALETNPEFWQDDYSKSILFNRSRNSDLDNFYFQTSEFPGDFMRITSFSFDDYDEAIKAALAVEPSLVNGLLYRTYGNNLDDFEEDTYVDMYIFQTGKKLGKNVTGVENFEESEKLVIEAYKDMYKDRNRKKKSYDYEDMFSNPKKVEDAYRKGDLDLMDSLDALSITSEAFEEKFLYKRNEIQAHSIDTILKKSSLFVAVGAAHLPGKRGVIELLRAKGYRLRPIRMDDRNSVQKDAIDKMRTPVNFIQQTSTDSFYHVNIPGKKFYRFTDWRGMDVVQYADMVNGAYYVVTRIKTNSLFQGHSNEFVHKKIDTLLYENIPGKILKKTPIKKNGYNGWEILNRTRRGDYQRYNIIVTPFEVIVFKMSGNGEYIKGGTEAQQFFGSIKLKPYDEKSWTIFQPTTGGFSVQLPHEPLLLKDAEADRMDYAAYDKTDENSYLIMKTNIHNYGFAEADSFDLDLMDESYAYSSFISNQLSHEFITVNGYPGLQCKYQHKDGSFSNVKYIVRGPVYYAAAVHYKTENENAKKFLTSFSIVPFIYPETKLRSDTTLHITVESPVYPQEKKKDKESSFSMFGGYNSDDDDDDDSYPGISDHFVTKFIGNDTIGEKIFVSYTKPGPYMFVKDSAKFWKKMFSDVSIAEDSEEDSTFIYKLDKKYDLPGNIKCRERQLTDTASSRLIWTKWLYKDGHLFTISTLTDTLDSQNPFFKKFFDSFRPADTLKGESIFTRKSQKFFDDFFNSDSAIAKKARRAMDDISFDSLDVPLIENAVNRLNWDMKNYMETKKHFINELGYLDDSSATDYLKQLYFKVKDTADLQNTILSALLKQETKRSFLAFKDLMLKEPPISDNSSSYTSDYSFSFRNLLRLSTPRIRFNSLYSGETWSELYDTLALTKYIFPDFLQMMNLDDYKDEVIKLMTTMVDSGFLKGQDYEPYYNKLYMEARQLLKKQIAKEDEDNIDKVTRKKQPDYDEDDDEVMDEGNTALENFSVLLMPFYTEKDVVKNFFDQLLKTKDQRLLYNTFMLMLRNDKPVPDSLFMTYAKMDDYRSELYTDLKKMKKLDKFPAAYNNQLELAKSLLQKDQYSYDKLDSLSFINKLPVTYKGKKGWVYFFKYKKMRDDNFWELGCAGMQPEKMDSIDIDNDDFTVIDQGKLENDKPVSEQLEKKMKELLNSKRMSALQFYEGKGYNLYKNYLSEMVKSERYHD